MTAMIRTTTAVRAPSDPMRRNVFIAGVLYLITFAASIPALILLHPVLDDSTYIISSGSDTRVLWGCLLDMVNALAAVGTSVALFSVLKRRNETLALGFVTSRMLEAAIIAVGVVSLLAVVTMRQDYAGTTGAGASMAVTTGQALVAVRDWTFLLGPGLMPAFNALLLGSLLYRSRLVPRIIPATGLIGAPLLLAAAIAVLFGHNDQVSTWSFVATLPIAAWEFSIGIWMIVKGFRPDAAEEEPAL